MRFPCPSPVLRAWRPGLAPNGADAARHSEVFASSGEASGAALALAFAQDRCRADERPWLWVQDKSALRLSGRPYRPGLPEALRHRLIHVAAKSPEDALFALEEGAALPRSCFRHRRAGGQSQGALASPPRAGSAWWRKSTACRCGWCGSMPARPVLRPDALAGARPRPRCRRAGTPRPPVRPAGMPSCSARGGILRENGCWVKTAAWIPLSRRGEDTKAWQPVCLAAVGEDCP